MRNEEQNSVTDRLPLCTVELKPLRSWMRRLILKIHVLLCERRWSSQSDAHLSCCRCLHIQFITQPTRVSYVKTHDHKPSKPKAPETPRAAIQCGILTLITIAPKSYRQSCSNWWNSLQSTSTDQLPGMYRRSGTDHRTHESSQMADKEDGRMKPKAHAATRKRTAAEPRVRLDLAVELSGSGKISK